MSQKVFAIRDVKSDSYGPLVAVASVGIARRTFLEAVRQPNSPLGQYPEDFMLYELGSYDAQSGAIDGLPVPVLVMTAIEALEVRPIESKVEVIK